jgi:hypothetical protein
VADENGNRQRPPKSFATGPMSAVGHLFIRQQTAVINVITITAMMTPIIALPIMPIIAAPPSSSSAGGVRQEAMRLFERAFL